MSISAVNLTFSFANKQHINYFWKQETLKNKYFKNIVIIKLIVEGVKAHLCILHLI